MKSAPRNRFVPRLGGRGWILAILSVTLVAQVAAAGPKAPSGDLDQDDEIDPADLQCLILAYRAWSGVKPVEADQCTADLDCTDVTAPTCRVAFGGFKVCMPSCLAPEISIGNQPEVACNDGAADSPLCLGKTRRLEVDMDCNMDLTVADVGFMVWLVLELPGGPDTPDFDNDGRLNFCDDDSDGDGDPDATDCAILDPAIHKAAGEACDGIDNDCDDLLDAADPDLVPGPCAKNQGVCAGITQEPDACVGGQWAECTHAQYLEHDPAYEATETMCDEKDNDCDGKVDEADPDATDCIACTNGSQGEAETDVDCGGPICDPCDESAGCLEDGDCALGLYCKEGTCEPLELEGGGCTDALHCATGHCQNGFCCDEGDCCSMADDCPASYQAAAQCSHPTSCQGTRTDAVCTAAQCQSAPVDDDSGCDESVMAAECGEYPQVFCNATEDQTAPPCAETCASSAGCAPTASCVEGSCAPHVCVLDGEVGATVSCELHLARDGADLDPAVVLHLSLGFDLSKLAAKDLWICKPPALDVACSSDAECTSQDPSWSCGTAGKCIACGPVELTNGDAQLASAHQVGTCRNHASTDCPDNRVTLLVWSTQTLDISEAWMDPGGAVQGPSGLVAVRFEVLEAGAQSVFVAPKADFTAADADAKTLPLTVRHDTGATPAHWIGSGAP